MEKSISNTLLRISNYLSSITGITDDNIKKLTEISRSSNLVNFYMLNIGAEKWTKNMLQQYCGINLQEEKNKWIYDNVYNFVQNIIDTMPHDIYNVLSSSISNYKQCIKQFPKIKQNLAKLNVYLQQQFQQVIDQLTYGGKDNFSEIVKQWDV